MKSEEYMEEIVLPTINEYFSTIRDRRRAMLACMTLIHLHDTLKSNGERPSSETTSKFFESMKDDCPECWTVYLVGISAKHMRHEKSGFTIDQLVERPPSRFGRAIWGLSRFGDVNGGVEALSLKASVDGAIRKTFAFLSKEFFNGRYMIQ